MAYEDPNAPSRSQTPASVTSVAAPPVTPKRKSGSWDWLWPSIAAVIIIKLLGIVAGLVTFGCYYWLRPKLGTLGAIAASGLIGTVVAISLMAMIYS